MHAFRAFVIATLNFVAFLAFFAAIALGVLSGMRDEFLVNIPYELPVWAGGLIGGFVAWMAASVVLGLLFVLIDIQDGVRDLIRVIQERDAA